MWQGTFDLNDRNVVITGGASGIGFALAKGLGQTGCRVMIAEPDEDRLAEAVEALRSTGVSATSHPCDVTSLEQVRVAGGPRLVRVRLRGHDIQQRRHRHRAGADRRYAD